MLCLEKASPQEKNINGGFYGTKYKGNEKKIQRTADTGANFSDDVRKQLDGIGTELCG